MNSHSQHLRNVAIIAHVDHGKTSLVDQLLYQSGLYREEELDKRAGGQHGLVLDSNDLERERGITILSKNCAVTYTTGQGTTGQGTTGQGTTGQGTTGQGTTGQGTTGQGTTGQGTTGQGTTGQGTTGQGTTYRINLIDTPGHADFGGEVERVLTMADGALLVVDAFEGPMPQTRFVLQKALACGLRPLVVVNKVDRPDSRPDEVVNEVFDLLADLGADDEALDFPVVYSSAKQGWAAATLEQPRTNMRDLFEAIVEHVPPPRLADATAPTQFLVTSIDFSDYVGRIAIGRVFGGVLENRQRVAVLDRQGNVTQQQILQLLRFEGLERRETSRVEAGDLCAVVGLDPIHLGDTIATPDNPQALPSVAVDEPTLHMTFRVNDGPFVGRDGKYLTSRQLGDRLEKELRSNVALRVQPGETMEQYRVSGRGLMHLGILIENMRREGFELCVGKPHVVLRENDGRKEEPIELLVVDVPEEYQSAVMALLGDRRAELIKMGYKTGTQGFIHLEFSIPARAMIGLRSRLLTATAGNAVIHHTLLGYEPVRGSVVHRTAGVLIANEPGQVTAYALDGLYDRGSFFVRPGDEVYEGQVVGENCKAGDLVVNVVRGKKLTNMRAAGKDDNSQVRPVREMSLEACLEYIDDDELVEVTPQSIRLRKIALKETDRRRQTRRQASSF